MPQFFLLMFWLPKYTDHRIIYSTYHKLLTRILNTFRILIKGLRVSGKVLCITSLPMAGSPLRPLQGGSSRTMLLREPRKLVSRTRTDERQVEGGGSSREPRADATRRDVVSAPPPPLLSVTINGTSGSLRSSMPLPHRRSHRNPPCSDAPRCSHSSTARSKAVTVSRSAIAVFCIDTRSTPSNNSKSSLFSIPVM